MTWPRSFRLLEIVDESFATNFTSDSYCMTIRTKWNAAELKTSLNLLHLLAFYDVEKVNFLVKAHRTHEKIVYRTECDTCTSCTVSQKLLFQHFALHVPKTHYSAFKCSSKRTLAGRTEATPSHTGFNLSIRNQNFSIFQTSNYQVTVCWPRS